MLKGLHQEVYFFLYTKTKYKNEVHFVLSLDNNILVFGAGICMIWFLFICDYMCSCSK